MLFFFENGKVAKVDIAAYQTKSNRRRLTGACSDKSPVVAMFHIQQDEEFAVISSDTRTLMFNSALLAPKATRSVAGVTVMSLKSNRRVVKAVKADESGIENTSRYRKRKLPSPGSLLRPEDIGENQLNMEL